MGQGSRRTMTRALAAATAATGAAAAFAAAGGLDATFGSGGVVHVAVGASTQLRDVAVQQDGKVLLGGWDRVGTANNHWRIRRIANDGSTDTDFGSSGSVTLFGSISNADDDLADLSLDGSGRIVAVGDAAVAGKGTSWTRRAAIARLNPSGSLDTTFGSGGTATLLVSGASWCEAIGAAHQPDGKIVVAGLAHKSVKSKSSNADDASIFVARYTSAGALDASFGSSGVAVNSASPAGITLSGHGGLALQSDGGIVVGCSQNDPGAADQSWRWTIVRFAADGTPDANFGIVRSSGDRLEAVAVDASDRVLGFGRRFTATGSDIVVARYGAAGATDTTFGTAGVRTVDLGALDVAFDGAVQSDGKIVASVISGTTSGFSGATLRLDSDGSLDSRYGTGGVGTRLFDLLEGNALVALAPDGRAVAAGYTSNPWEWWSARYDAN